MFDTILQIKGNYFPEKVTDFPCHGDRRDSAFMYYLIPMRGLRTLACWGCGFESHWGGARLSVLNPVCCQVEVSATSRFLVQRSPTECLCVIAKPQKWRRPRSQYGFCTTKKYSWRFKLNVYFFLTVWLIFGGRYYEYCQLRLNEMKEFSFTEHKDYLDTCCIWTAGVFKVFFCFESMWSDCVWV